MTKVPLQRRDERKWQNPEMPPDMPVTAALPLWRSRRGFHVHRPRFGTVYPKWQGGTYIALTWLCGNQTCEPVPVTEVKLPYVMCDTCECRYQKMSSRDGEERAHGQS